MASQPFHPVLSRRRFCITAAASAVAYQPFAALAQATEGTHFNVAEFDRAHILEAADAAVARTPAALPPSPPEAKAPAGVYVSQDPEWWPSASNPQVYEHRVGTSNPAAFSAHRDALVAMNADVAACVVAWRLTRTASYAEHAMALLRLWFLNPATSMQPQLDLAGCVPGTWQGTPRGVEDTIMLADTARATAFLCSYDGVATESEAAGLRGWFGSFAAWLDESKPGGIARDARDRLAICWALQAAEASRFARNDALRLQCLHLFRDKLLRQMNFDGQFPAELHRPDAYAASIVTLDCLSVLCESLSSPMDRLWDYALPDGRGMRSAVAFLYPALVSRSAWKFPADIEHFQQLPGRQPSLLLAGRAYSRPDYIVTWKALPAGPVSMLQQRRLPIRQPALWTVRAPA